eukprot:NODE_1803_length_1059_cov_314.622510.p1 GENE.NODE_1803_length_1059_cov_314.622510~~NODE_1803_length_1059_cov_314.622510.p1  ORF type:complete len:297 (-),score=42.09 NODE_1803_length_1059_cov_314.622510:169-1035(-)
MSSEFQREVRAAVVTERLESCTEGRDHVGRDAAEQAFPAATTSSQLLELELSRLRESLECLDRRVEALEAERAGIEEQAVCSVGVPRDQGRFASHHATEEQGSWPQATAGEQGGSPRVAAEELLLNVRVSPLGARLPTALVDVAVPAEGSCAGRRSCLRCAGMAKMADECVCEAAGHSTPLWSEAICPNQPAAEGLGSQCTTPTDDVENWQRDPAGKAALSAAALRTLHMRSANTHFELGGRGELMQVELGSDFLAEAVPDKASQPHIPVKLPWLCRMGGVGGAAVRG